MQLQGHLESFRAAGLGVVAITYDAPELQRPFIEEFGIEYPLLSDVDAATVSTLGILNEDYAPGDSAYGIPYPGVFILDNGMTVRGKIFLEDYQTRVGAEQTLSKAEEVLRPQASTP